MDIKFDQHFLNDDKILSQIVNCANITNSDIIFEIGPGKGSLTRKILDKNPMKLISIEKDETLNIDIHDENFNLIIGDGLEEMDNHIFSKIIANIPYSITEPLYTKILDKQMPQVVLLHGIDFYKNIIQRDTRWNYFISAFYNIELICEVPGDKFTPETKVKSVVVKLTLKKEITQTDKLIQNLWFKRSRTVENAITFSLVDTFSITKKDAKLIFEKLNLDDQIKQTKLETLSNKDLTEIIEKLI